MEELRPRLPHGVPEMHIPRMEPLFIESAVLDSGQDLRVDFTNINLYGLTSFKVVDGSFDIENNEIRVKLDFEKAFSETDYKINGKLLFLNLRGAGKANGTLRK